MNFYLAEILSWLAVIVDFCYNLRNLIMGKLWGKFVTFGLIALAVSASSLFLQEKSFVQAKQSEPQKIMFLEGDMPKGFRQENDRFFLNTTGQAKNILMQFSGRDIVEVFPGTTLEGTFFEGDREGGREESRVLIRVKQGRIVAYRVASMPEMQIFAGNEVVLQGEGIVSASMQNGVSGITAVRYPIVIATLPENATNRLQSFFDERIELRLILPESVGNDIPTLFQKDTEFRKRILADEEKKARDRGFQFRTPNGLSFVLANAKVNLAKPFSFREELKRKREQKFSQNIIEDAAFEFLLQNPDKAKERLAHALPVHVKNFAKEFSYVSFEHPWYFLDQELRQKSLETLSFEGEYRDLAFELLNRGLNLSFDFQELGLGASEKRGALIVFGEELLRRAPLKSLYLFEKYLRSIADQPDFFDALYAKMLIVLQDKIIEKNPEQKEAFLIARKDFFEKGKALVEGGKVSLPKGREALLLVLGEMNDRRDEILQQHSMFITFLFSPEAESSVKPFQEQYQAFLAREEETKQIEKILAGEVAMPEVRGAADYATEAQANFKETGIELVAFLPSEIDPHLFNIQEAKFSGITFAATYDGRQKVFSRIKIGSEVYERSVSLENFPSFLLAISNVRRQAEELDTEPIQAARGVIEEEGVTKVERVLKAKVMEKLDLLQITFDEKNIEIIDVASARFLVKKATFPLEDKSTVTVTFEFLNQTNEVENVKVESEVGELVIAEKFPLAILKERVELLAKRAKLEKEREEKPPAEEVF